MASDEDRLTQIVRNEMALQHRDRQVMLPFYLEHEILFQMRPDRRAGKRLTLPVQKWKLRSKPKCVSDYGKEGTDLGISRSRFGQKLP